jgi:hypothetical protein
MLLIITEQETTVSVDENYLVMKPYQLYDIHPMTPCLVIVDMSFTVQCVTDWLTKRTRSTLLWSLNTPQYDNLIALSGDSRHCILNESVLSFGDFLHIFITLYYSRLWDRNNAEVIISSNSGEWESYFLNNKSMAIYSEKSVRKKVEQCNSLIFIIDPELNLDTIEAKVAQEKHFYSPKNIRCFFNVNGNDTVLFTFF